MSNQDRYRFIVKKINALTVEMRKRTSRCAYLKKRGDVYEKLNPEQAEAYYERLERHKPQLCDELEEIERFENELRKIPQKWIV